MIIASQTCQYLQDQLPEISDELSPERSLFGTLRALSEFSCRTVREQDFGKLKRCFNVVAGLYENGSAVVRSAVENVFVYSFSRLLTIAQAAKAEVKSLIPPSLLALYMNQVMHHGY